MGWHRLLAQIETLLTRECRLEQPLQRTRPPRLQIGHHQKAELMAALEGYRANAAHFKQFVSFSSEGYTKNFVMDIKRSSGDETIVVANVIVMCWAPNQRSAFHGHEGSCCFVKVLQGQISEERRPHPAGRPHQMEPAHRRPEQLQENQVAYIDDELACHRVTNCSAEEAAVTLHIYVPPYRKCRLFEPSDSLTMSGSRLIDVVLAEGLSSGQSA